MYLTVNNLAQHLISTGLISAESVVSGDLVISETGRRNRNFRVTRRSGPGLFIKQIKTSDQQSAHTMARESAFYNAVHSNPRYAPLKRIVPPFVRRDAARQALVLEDLPKAESLMLQQLRSGEYTEDSAELLGTLLATVHPFGAGVAQDPDLQVLCIRQPPWPMMLDTIGQGFFQSCGPGGAALNGVMQQFPPLIPSLAALRNMWDTTSLIHGDMKWDNCLVWRDDNGKLEMRLADWELAELGDAAWDIATVFKDYLLVPLLQSQPGSQLKRQALESLLPRLRTFWTAYVRTAGLAGPARAMLLHRSVCFTAARLVTAMLEYLSAAPNQLHAPTAMAQTAMSIVQFPQVATHQLLGDAA